MAHEPDPKRRRTGNPTSADTIAQSNAHLQFLTTSRQNRRLQDLGQNQLQTVASPSQAAANSNRANERDAHGGATATSTQSDSRTSRPLRLAPTPLGAIIGQQGDFRDSQAVPLVSYQIPSMADAMLGLPTPVSSVTAANARKSLEGSKTLDLPGLPSPAPSDENTDSPTLTALQPPPRVRSSTSTRQLGEGSNRPRSRVPSAVPPINTAVQAGQQPQQFMPHEIHSAHPHSFQSAQGSVDHQNSLPHSRSPSHTRPHHLQQTANSAAPQSPFTGPHGQVNGQSVPTQQVLPSQASAQVMQPQQNAAQLSGYSPQILLKYLDDTQARLSATASLSPTDHGRLILLTEAIRRNDYFYQVLSQLFCLRTISPMSLPRSVRNLPNSCYEYLNTLLCPNWKLCPELLNIMANFPEPVMDVYEGTAKKREFFEGQVQNVKSFLEKLPTEWDKLVRECKDMESPPLVQDLIERLRLRSMVLQTTAFRAIARMFYGVGEDDAKGISAVERIHRIDQDSYMRLHHVRDDSEKQEAYYYLKMVYTQWKERQRNVGQAAQVDYEPAHQVIDYFHRPTRSVLQAMQSNAPQNRPTQSQMRPRRQLVQQMQLQMQPQQQLRASHLPPQPRPRQDRPPLQDSGLVAQSLRTRSDRSLPYPPPGGLQQQSMWYAPGTTQHLAFQPSPKAHVRHPRCLYPDISETPRAQPTQPDPTLSALHQAHLRSPVLAPLIAKTSSSRLYRHVIGFAMPPTKLKRSSGAQMLSLHVSTVTMARVAQTHPPQMHGGRPHRMVDEGSLMFRLRCSSLPKTGFASESAWATADNYWPESFYFEFNGTALETRRKLHHGRYLPVDLTNYVRAGRNELKVLANQHAAHANAFEYALAVEVVGTTSHQNIIDKIRRIPASETVDSIKKALANGDSGSAGDDDDIAVTSSSCTIQLFEPYSGCRIFDTPVRGVACSHKDCFDLTTFLDMCKREKPQWPTVVDCWRCPLCRGDVRPQTLVLDEFLLQVRAELAAQDLLDTRAIIIEADGSWKAKQEERTGVRSPSLEREEAKGTLETAQIPTTTVAAPKKHIEIIELD